MRWLNHQTGEEGEVFMHDDPHPAGQKPSNPKDRLGVNKVPLHLVPPVAVAVEALALLDGASKYGRANWRAVGVRASVYYDAMRRHLDRWFEGEEAAADSGVHHLGHVRACAAILLDAEAQGNLVDDRNFSGDVETLDRLNLAVPAIRERYDGKPVPIHYTIGCTAPAGISSPRDWLEPL